MIGPLKANIDIAETMIRLLQNNTICLDMVKTIQVTSKLVLFHAQDLLDQRFLEGSMFNAVYTQDSVTKAIDEIIGMVQ